MATPRARRNVTIATLVVALLITAIAINGGVVGGVKGLARGVVAPFAWTINQIARPFADLFGGAVNYSTVVAQERQLRAEIGRLRMNASETSSLRTQLSQLESALHTPYIGSLSDVVGQVTSNSPTNFAAAFTIDVGRNQGVLAGMPVVANGGLVGRVIATGNSSSTVLELTDPTSVVGCTFHGSTMDVLVSGRGVNSPLVASSVPLNAPLSPGTTFFTDALNGGIYPPGLPVATIKTALLSPGSSTYDLSLRPSADLHHLNYVDVVLWEPNP